MTDMTLIQSQIVELRTMGWTHPRIGERLGISVDTVDYEVKKLRKAGIDLPTRSNGSIGDWTAERVARLRLLWGEGNSASIIAGLLSRDAPNPISRNAVIGKLSRLGLNRAGRPRPRTRTAPRGPVQRQRPSVAPVMADAHVPPASSPFMAIPAPVEPCATFPAGTGVTIAELRFPISQCRWIDGEPDGAVTLYCGARTEPGKSYCDEHNVRVWGPRQRRAA